MAAWVLPAVMSSVDTLFNIYSLEQQKKMAQNANISNQIESAQQAQWNLNTNMANNAFNYRMWQKNNAFNVEQRNYMNDYNSPKNQMKRFKEAGLNPHLIYGQGSPGQQPSAVSASPAKMTPPSSYQRAQIQPIPARNPFNFADMSTRIINANQVEADIQLKRQQALTEAQQSLLVAAKIPNINIDTRRKSFDLGLAKQMAPFSLQAKEANVKMALENVRKAFADANYATNSLPDRLRSLQLGNSYTERKIAGQESTNINIAATKRLINSRITATNMDTRIKQAVEVYKILENRMAGQSGIFRGDNIIYRQLISSKLGRSAHKFLNLLGDSYDEYEPMMTKWNKILNSPRYKK